MVDPNLYGRLFRYRARETRAPLEDFLSEALADLLNRMPAREQADLLASILRTDDVWQAAFDHHRHSWQTQMACDGGFADIVLKLDGKPAVVIENKLHSGVRLHGENGNQLMTYGTWLRRNRNEALPSGLVLLTHGTDPPKDLMSGAEYGVETREVLRWSRLARWLRSCSDDADGAAWRILAAELHAFLEEKSMTNDTIESSDVAAARLFLPGWMRWRNTFDLLWSGADEVRSGFLSSKTSELSLSQDGGMLWNWSYCAAPLPHRSWLAFALRFPDASEWYVGAALPDQPHLMLLIGKDGNDLPVERIGPVPAGWLVHEREVMTAVPLHDLPAEPDEQAVAMGVWARRRVMEARELLLAMRS